MRQEMPLCSPRRSAGSMCADDADVLAVEVEPDGGYAQTAVRHDGGEIGDAFFASPGVQRDKQLTATFTLRWRTIRRTASARADPPTGPVVAVGTPPCARSGSGGRGRPRSPTPRR